MFKPGQSGNPNGRPKALASLTEPNQKEVKENVIDNRLARQRNLMELARKLKPLQAKAISEAAKILDAPLATENGKLKAAAMIISTYKSLISEIYDPAFDEKPKQEEKPQVQQPVVVEEIQKEPPKEEKKVAVFSLKMVE